ncbi:unnamed protein product [Cochlearia groenlandica]
MVHRVAYVVAAMVHRVAYVVAVSNHAGAFPWLEVVLNHRSLVSDDEIVEEVVVVAVAYPVEDGIAWEVEPLSRVVVMVAEMVVEVVEEPRS